MPGTKLNRRQFCKSAIGLGAAMNLTALGVPLGKARARDLRRKRPLPGTRGPAEVSMVSAPTAEEGMSRAVDRIDGWSFLTPGSTVLVKPSSNSGNPYPFNTSPAAVHWTVERLYEAGAGHVIVADQSYYITSTETNMKNNGIYDAATAAGAEVLYLENRSWLAVHDEQAGTWEGVFHLSDILEEVDHIVSLPRISTHIDSGFTIALKIWVGTLDPEDRKRMHFTYRLKLDHCLAELSLGVRADLSVIDATSINTRYGPDSGEAVPAGVFMAARDPLAMDVAAVALLKSIIQMTGSEDCEGRDPILCDPAKSIWSFWQIWRAVELGIGIAGPGELTLLTNAAEPGGLDPLVEERVLAEIAHVQAPALPWACFIDTALRD